MIPLRKLYLGHSARGQYNGESWASFSVFGPDAAVVLARKHSTDGEAEASPGTVLALGVRSVLFEHVLDMLGRDRGA